MKRGKKSQKKQAADARMRAELIVKVQSGVLTATEAARQLGISRKTYYKWEARALEAMVVALEEGRRGRPQKPQDAEKEGLQQQVAALRKELLLAQQRLAIRRLLDEDGQKDRSTGPRSAGNRRSGKKGAKGSER
jgi:transposase